MEEKTIQSVPIMPFALMVACVMAAIGLVVGIVQAVMFGALFNYLIALPTMPAVPSGFNLGWFSVIFGVGAIIMMPIMFFIIGLIQGLIVAAVYNFLAPRIGGIRVRIKEENRQTPQ